VQGSGPEASVKPAHPILDPENRENLTVSEGHLMLWELLSVSFGIGALAVCIVDVTERPGFGWSLYPIASIVLAWILVTALLRSRRPSFAAFAIPAVAIPAYLVALDLIDGDLDWSLSIGVPICLLAEAAIGIAALAIVRARRKGANIAAIALAAVAIFCLGLESTLDLASGKGLSPGWSSIVLASLLPISLYLFYLHYRILGKKGLRRFFRL
jgi:peptidoglycan/LPS O-acetylase OafA/YrhL